MSSWVVSSTKLALFLGEDRVNGTWLLVDKVALCLLSFVPKPGLRDFDLGERLLDLGPVKVPTKVATRLEFPPGESLGDRLLPRWDFGDRDLDTFLLPALGDRLEPK